MKRFDLMNWCLGGVIVALTLPISAQESDLPTPKEGVETTETEPAPKADLIDRAPQMTVEQLEEMVQVHQRLGNDETVAALAKVIQEKDPDNQTAKAALAGEPTEAGESTVVAPETPSVADLAAERATRAVAAGRHDEAARILLRLKRDEFRNVSFPFQQDYAYALLESGKLLEAKNAFAELANDSRQSSKDRSDARSTISEIDIQVSNTKAATLLAAGKDDEAISLAESVFKNYPKMDGAWSLKADVLTKAGRHGEAVDFLIDFKKRSGRGPFAYQQTLAYAVYESEGREASEPYFNEIIEGKYPDTVVADATSRLRDFAVERLYEMGVQALKAGDAETTLEIGNRMMTTNRVPDEAFELRAVALKAMRRFSEATLILEKFKSSRFSGRAFPMQVDLGDCYYGSGEFLKAKDAYTDAINVAAPEDSVSVADAKTALLELAPIIDPSISTYTEFFTEEEGDMFRAAVEARTGLIGRNQFKIRANRDEVELADSILESGGYNRWDATATYRRLLLNSYYADFSAGGSEDDFIYGLGLGRIDPEGLGWNLSLAGGERATDSLTLEALDGRQDSVRFDIEGALKRGWYLSGNVVGRQVHIDGVDIGQGIEGNIDFGKTLREASPISTGVYIGYTGKFSRFDHDSISTSEGRDLTGLAGLSALDTADLVSALVEEKINRQSLNLILSRNLGPRLLVALTGSVGYEAVDKQVVYRVGSNAKYQISERATIEAALDYDSSGSAGNSGENVIFGSLFFRLYF